MLRRLLAISLLPALAAAQAPSAKVIERYVQMLEANPAEGTALDRLWQAYAADGRTGTLIAQFEAQPTYAAQMILGLLLRKAGRDADALAAFQRAAASDPRSAAPALALGRTESALGHHAESLAWFEKAAALLPDGPQKTDALLQLGAAAIASGDLEKTAEAWERTATLAPTDLVLRRQLADTYVRNQLGKRAIPHLDYIVGHGAPQERAEALQQIGAIHQSHGDQDAAIVAIEKALAFTSPGNWLRAELEGQLIRLHERYHRTPELEAKWRKFAEDNPRDLGAYLQLIELYGRLGDHEQQLVWVEKLVTVAPKNLEYRRRLARLLAQMDLLDRAAGAYDELLGSEPRNIDLVFERARIDVQLELPTAAGDRIAALLARSDNDEGIRTKALEFYHTHRLHSLAEAHLRADAAGNSPDAIVALASFYFASHREADARTTLTRLVNAAEPPAQRAAAHFRIAGELKAQNDMAGAVQAVRAAIELREDAREFHFMLGELEAAAGRYAGAEVAFERAFALSASPAEATEADQRLYDSLRNQKQPGEDDPQPGVPRPESAAMATSSAAQSYLLNLLRAAVEQPGEERWLRVARWQQWSRNPRGAIDAAERALALNAGSIPAHDFLARLFAGDPQGAGAQQHLRDLARLDPANRPAYLRRLGQVQLQAGQVEDALTTFRLLVSETPGDLDALNDLAIAQQRGEQWDQALATLKQLHAISPASRKHDVVTALLRVFDRLGLRPQAAELLLQQIDGGGDSQQQFAHFSDLLTHCSRHGLLDWLRAQFEARHKLRVDDYFTEIALGRVLKAQGNKAAAFEVLADAALSAPDPAEALPELVREAEELHRLGAAVKLQDRYVRVVPQAGPEGWLRLAELQERSLQPEAAAATWARLTAKFPRDVSVLEKAAAFSRTWGRPQRAILLLRRIREIEPGNQRALAQLAELSLTDGEPAEAEECLEQMLAQTEPPKPGEPILYPAVVPDDSSRLEMSYRSTVLRRTVQPSADALKTLRTLWLDKSGVRAPAGDVPSRLATIQDLAELTAAKGDPGSLAQWVERWQRPEVAPTERLWALYFSGASTQLLDEVQKLIAAKPDDAGRVNAFIWLALETGEFERLGAWNNDRTRTPVERDFLMLALEQYLGAHRGAVPAGLVENLFPDGHRANLWQAATGLAQRGHLRAAVQLGTRVLDRLNTQRAEGALELALWHVQLGDLAAATRTLRGSIEGTHDTLNASFYAALRTLHLLLPPRERIVLAQEFEAKLDDATRPVQSALTRALLAALGGDEKRATAQLDRLIALRPMSAALDGRATAATRQWDFVLGTGVQFVNWHLPWAAAHLWERALADDAAIALQVQQPAPEGDAIRARALEVRTRLTALRLMRGEPDDAAAVIDSYAHYAPPDGLLPLAETLEAFGANPLAVTIYRQLWALEPANPHALRNALGACRNANDWTTTEAILTRVVSEGHFRPNDAAHRDLVHQLVDALARRGDFAGARQQLAAIGTGGPLDARTSAKLADLHQRSDQPADAEAAWRRVLAIEPGNAAARLSLATLLDSMERTPEAIELLEKVTGSEIDARLATLNVKADRLEEALATLERVPEADRPRVVLATANELKSRGDGDNALRLLRVALGRTRNSKMGFALQSRLVELLPVNRADALREMRRLRQAADGDSQAMSAYFALAQREAKRLEIEPELRDEVIHAWDAGRGDVVAGAAWLAWQIRSGERAGAAQTWTQLSAHAGLDFSALQPVLDAFPPDGVPPMRLEILERTARLDAADPKRLAAWARALHSTGDRGKAAAVAGELAARAVFDAGLLGSTAELYLAIGDPTRAVELYQQISAADPAGQKVELHTAYARLLLGQKRFDAARSELRILSRNPAANPVPLIVEFLVASGQLARFESELADFHLPPTALLELRGAVFDAELARGDVAGAVRLAGDYPALLDGNGAPRLCDEARRARQFDAVATVLENALAQGATDLAADLAGLCADWAEAELAALQVESAITHLERAHELRPDHWPAAERLARLRLERQEPQLATKVLNQFIEAATDDAARDKARQLLSRVPGV
ncbi:MAG: tetratricopeptide repeat protein [Chthoniobacteraceae bacterium]